MKFVQQEIVNKLLLIRPKTEKSNTTRIEADVKILKDDFACHLHI